MPNIYNEIMASVYVNWLLHLVENDDEGPLYAPPPGSVTMHGLAGQFRVADSDGIALDVTVRPAPVGDPDTEAAEALAVWDRAVQGDGDVVAAGDQLASVVRQLRPELGPLTEDIRTRTGPTMVMDENQEWIGTFGAGHRLFAGRSSAIEGERDRIIRLAEAGNATVFVDVDDTGIAIGVPFAVIIRKTGEDSGPGGIPLGGRFVRITGTYARARAEMLRMFGQVWCDLYDDETKAGVEEFGLSELNLTRPAGRAV